MGWAGDVGDVGDAGDVELWVLGWFSSAACILDSDGLGMLGMSSFPGLGMLGTFCSAGHAGDVKFSGLHC